MTVIHIAAVLVALMALAVAACSAWRLHTLNECRDRRPLVMPVFAGVAYVVLRLSWIMAGGGKGGFTLIDAGWLFVDAALLGSIAVLLNGYCERRGSESCRGHK